MNRDRHRYSAETFLSSRVQEVAGFASWPARISLAATVFLRTDFSQWAVAVAALLYSGGIQH